MTRACLNPTCSNPATTRGWCAQHARTNDRDINRAGYHLYRTKRWQTTRNHQLFHHPLCAHCQRNGIDEIATDVHHRTDLADGGDPWSPHNLESLCHPCHSKHTRALQTA